MSMILTIHYIGCLYNNYVLLNMTQVLLPFDPSPSYIEGVDNCEYPSFYSSNGTNISTLTVYLYYITFRFKRGKHGNTFAAKI